MAKGILTAINGPRFVILFSDGLSSRIHRTISSANKLKNDAVIIFAIREYLCVVIVLMTE